MKRIFWLLAIMFSVPLRAHATTLPLPLSTSGSRIVDANGQTVQLKSVNWYGTNLEPEVVAGLDKQPLDLIVKLIRSWGFNSVRLPFSNAMLHKTTPVDPKWIKANPQLLGKTSIEVMDAVIDALAAEDVMVILNNHSTFSQWCCGFDNNGLWYFEGKGGHSTQDWENDWLALVERYRGKPDVVGVDLRNEVRTQHWRGTIFPEVPNWGKGNHQDWHKAAQNLGNRILNQNPSLLIVVEAINWEGTVPILGSGDRPFLRLVPKTPIQLAVPNKLVYAVHSYGFIGPRHNGDPKTSKGQKRYSDMDEQTLLAQWKVEWSFVLDEGYAYTTPVWVSEFGVGADSNDEGEKRWFHTLTQYLTEHQIGFAYWPLNHESYGLVDETWSKKLDDDWRAPDLLKLLQTSH
ncbi:MAG: cellulase family glycosylhydrolase [Chitinophagaceae bacterium]|nr:cellulase family glycosylhydrolase [Oligoflexus sp.]